VLLNLYITIYTNNYSSNLLMLILKSKPNMGKNWKSEGFYMTHRVS